MGIVHTTELITIRDIKICIQIKHKVDYLQGYKLYLHPFDRVEGRRPEIVKVMYVQFIDPVDNQLSVLFVFYYCPFNIKMK